MLDFATEYAKRSDDELLHLASARHSLTTEAVAALDAELHRRNLTEPDRVEYQRFVKEKVMKLQLLLTNSLCETVSTTASRDLR